MPSRSQAVAHLTSVHIAKHVLLTPHTTAHSHAVGIQTRTFPFSAKNCSLKFINSCFMLQAANFIKIFFASLAFCSASTTPRAIVTQHRKTRQRKKPKPESFSALARLLKCKIIKNYEVLCCELPANSSSQHVSTELRQLQPETLNTTHYSSSWSLTGNSIFCLDCFCCDDAS